MRLIVLLIIVDLIGVSVNAQELKKTKYWHNYIAPVLETNLLLKDKKIYVFQNEYPIMTIWHPEFIDTVFIDNGITKENWSIIYNVWRLNVVRTNSEWFKGITNEKKNTLLKRYNRMKIKKFEVIGVSPVFFISSTTYLVEITRYCFGICSLTTLYLMEYDKDTKSYQLKYSKNVNAS